jgi:hypothetical protein
MYLLLLSFRYEGYLMSEQSKSDIREVSVVKRIASSDSEDYVSVQLRSSEDSLEILLENAMNAVSEPSRRNIDTKLGIQ